MKTADIEPLTVVYAHREGSYNNTVPTVVLAAKLFSTTRAADGVKKIVPAHRGARPVRGRYSFESTTGIPVVTLATRRSEVTEAQLLAAAKELAAELPTGDNAAPQPKAPEGMAFDLVRPQSIHGTWSDHQAAEAAAELARLEHEARRLDKATAEAQAKRAVYELLEAWGVTGVTLTAVNGYYGTGSTRVGAMDWDELHKLLFTLVVNVGNSYVTRHSEQVAEVTGELIAKARTWRTEWLNDGLGESGAAMELVGAIEAYDEVTTTTRES
jgi:hypothetical protein